MEKSDGLVGDGHQVFPGGIEHLVDEDKPPGQPLDRLRLLVDGDLDIRQVHPQRVAAFSRHRFESGIGRVKTPVQIRQHTDRLVTQAFADTHSILRVTAGVGEESRNLGGNPVRDVLGVPDGFQRRGNPTGEPVRQWLVPIRNGPDQVERHRTRRDGGPVVVLLEGGDLRRRADRVAPGHDLGVAHQNPGPVRPVGPWSGSSGRVHRIS